MAVETGITSQEAIREKSLYVLNYMTPSGKGRKPILSCEQMDYSKDNLIGTTLEDKSSYFLVPLMYPEIYMLQGADTLITCIKACINYIAHTATGVNGFADLTLESNEGTFKTPFFRMPVFTNIGGPTTSITLSVPAELSGYFITEQLRHWISAISDPNSRVAHYNNYNVDFNNWSHSCAMAYIKPNKTWRKVHYGALFMLMVPKGAPTSNFNAEASDSSVMSLSIEFSVCVIDTQNLRVREFCNNLLSKYREFIVIDTATYGEINNTQLTMLDDLDISGDKAMKNITVGA